jgi:hypothetical protein
MQTLTITGTVDGHNVTFILSPSPAYAEIYRNQLLQSPFTDYSRTGAMVEFVNLIPQSGDILVAMGEV